MKKTGKTSPAGGGSKGTRQLIGQVKTLLTDTKKYWKTPPAGKYVNYRSIFSYSVGGIGIYAIIFLQNTIAVSSTNVIISNQTGLDPLQLQLMYYFTFFISIFFTGVRAKMIDSARSKRGKYLPYILTMGIPTAALSCAMVWMPYDLIDGMLGSERAVTAVNWIIAFVLNLGLNFTYGFMYEAYDNLILVMSPDTQERSDVVSVKSIVYSLAPTVLNPLIPLLQGWMGSDDIYDIRIYKALYPPTAIFGVALSVLVYAYTEEKIVQPKDHIPSIRFSDALRGVAKNKYFWILSLAGWIGFLESSYNYILGWLYNYGGMCTPEEYAIITFIYGNASLWGMLAAPFAIRKFGKKKVLIVTNFFNILFIALLYPSIEIAHSIWLVLGCLYMNAVVGSFAHILNPSLNADIRDYQQYISGERIDGMFAAVGLIGSAISLVTSSVIPAIFKSYGISSDNGYENMYDILKDRPDEIMYPLVYLLIVLGIIGATLNVIPYFFYDLSEKKQKGIIRILKIRAMLEDHAVSKASRDEIAEALNIIEETKQFAGKAPSHTEKQNLSELKKKKADKSLIKTAKKAVKEENRLNELIEISDVVKTELDVFGEEYMIIALDRAEKCVKLGPGCALSFEDDLLSKAKALPKTTESEKKIREDAKSFAKSVKVASRCLKKHFPGGIIQPDKAVINELYDEADRLSQELASAVKDKYKTKKNKDAAKTAEAKERIKLLRRKKKENDREIKAETDRIILFNRAAKPYADAVRLTNRKKSFDSLDEIRVISL